MSDPSALVYADLRGVPQLVGRLWTTASMGRESATFEYEKSWLANPERYALEQALTLGPGPFHATTGQRVFGALGDSAPDWWGRTLLIRSERRRASSPPRITSLPMTKVRKICACCWRRDLRWEAVALSLAQRCGIRVSEWRIEAVPDSEVLLLRRFDRRGRTRIPFLSALSMLGEAERETRSCVEIADALRQHGAAPQLDLPELWCRMVFNVMISNSDDHLRNHAFLFDGTAGWRLSPAYDLNPVPADAGPHVLSTAIGLDGDLTASVELAMEVAAEFALKPADARAIAAHMSTEVRKWRRVAKSLGATAAELDHMASAFER